jgi:CheY-like chemotaxis protein
LIFGRGNATITPNVASQNILVAEDNPDDAYIFKIMCKRAGLPHIVHIVENGQQVIDWLSGQSVYSNRAKYPLPDRVLLDLKMPVKTGFETLEWIRAQQSFNQLPVAILSSSDEHKDVKKAYELGATTYFVKSATLKDVIQYLGLN